MVSGRRSIAAPGEQPDKAAAKPKAPASRFAAQIDGRKARTMFRFTRLEGKSMQTQ
jgi:hypothetical protein